MKVTSYNITLRDAYISCEDVPASACCNVACSDCPFINEDISLEDLIKGYMEKYNDDN